MNLQQRLKCQGSNSSSTNRSNHNGANTQQLKDRVESLWHAATNVEVCFLVDITGSMANMISAVKEQVRFVPAFTCI